MKTQLCIGAMLAALTLASAADAQRAPRAPRPTPADPTAPGPERPAIPERAAPLQREHGLLEIEPHVALALTNGTGVGFGARLGFNVVPRGIVPRFDDTLAIGVGADWIRYGNCGDYRGDLVDCDSVGALWIPAVAQWNFFVARRLSVFAEGGLALVHASYRSPCAARDLVGNSVPIGCADSNDLKGVVALGGRYEPTDHVAVTVRLGYPYFSAGVSYL